MNQLWRLDSGSGIRIRGETPQTGVNRISCTLRLQLEAISRWAVFQIQLAGAHELVESGGHVFQESSNPEGPGNSPIPAV